MRMLDAMAGVPPRRSEQPHRSGVMPWLALAASAAAIILVLLTTPLRIARGPEPAPNAVVPGPSAAAPSVGQSVSTPATKPASSRQVRGDSTARPSVILQQPARVARPTALATGQPAIAGYAVGFGEFASHAAAEIRMHLIRGKGYLVYVTRIGDSFHVATRPYRTRTAAERLANALQEIGLPARTFIAATPAL